MNKIIIGLFVGLLLMSTVSAANWYVSTSSSGTASGNSWANKRILSSFNWANVQPGDTVYIDGGANGLTYDYTFVPAVSGTVNNKITITRGVDATHNGTPTFTGNDNRDGANINGDYLVIDNLVFKNGGVNGGGVLYVPPSSTGVEIRNCEIWHPRTIAVIWEGSDGKFIRNTVKTGISSNSYATDGMWIGAGGGEGGSHTGHSGNIEIAYNYFLNQHTGSGHSDSIQITADWQWEGGLTKIHHNFIALIPETTNDQSDLIYIDNGAGGEYQIYNNILVNKDNVDSGYMNGIYDMFDVGITAKVYNNIMYCTGASSGKGERMWNFYDIDYLDVRNNVFYGTGGLTKPYGIDYYTEHYASYINFQNNQYLGANQNAFAYLHEPWTNHPLDGTTEEIGWNAWKTRFNESPASEYAAVTFVGGDEYDPNSYALASSSTGVNEGTPIALFNDDYRGTIRPQGSAWDVGAFEYVSGTIYHPADTNQNGCISLGEISVYVGLWLNGNGGVTISQVSSAVSTWLQYGC